jgi:hypothetical protein
MKIISHIEHDADGTPHLTLCVVESGQQVEQVEDNEAGRKHLFIKYRREDMENEHWCGNLFCSCSSGIHEGLTFGSGKWLLVRTM